MAQAVVVRKNEKGEPEAYVFEFPGGISAFGKWANSLNELVKKVDVGGHWLHQEGMPEMYDQDSDCNTIAFLVGTRPQVVGWNLSEMTWLLLKSNAENQQKEVTLGRPAALVRRLGTWRKWAKKEGAVI